MCKTVFKKVGAAAPPVRAEVSVDGLLEQAAVHVRHKRLADALALLDQAVKQQPGHAKAHGARGVVLIGLGRGEEARRALETAYKLAPPAPPAPIRPGERVGSYEIERQLGEGGFGVVFLARDVRSGERYALKSFREQRVTDPSARAGFRAEAQVWVDLEKHPNIVRAHFVDELAGRLFIAMELIEPGPDGVNSLEGALAKRKIGLEQAVRWGIQICHAMEHAQSKGVLCHRDLKPPNILLARDNTIKVADFGLAIVGKAKGEAAGTPHYMPAEQWNGAPANARADIYATGIILYQLVAGGRLPFDPDRPTTQAQVPAFFRALRQMHIQLPPPPIETPLWPVIFRCLQKLPNQRYQSFGELRADLSRVLVGLGASAEVAPQVGKLEGADLMEKGLSLAGLGRHAEAIACFDQALGEYPDNPALWTNRGSALFSLKKFTEAVACFDRALALEPDNDIAMRNKADALFELGRHDEALALKEKAFDTTSPTAWTTRGFMLARLGRKDEALVAYERALAIDPRFMSALANKVELLREMERTQDAVAVHQLIAKLDPTDAGNLTNLAYMLLQLKRYEEALAAADRAIAADPQLAGAHLNRGAVWRTIGRHAEAAASFAACVKLEPSNTMAWWSLGEMEKAQGRVAEALRAYEQVTQRETANKRAIMMSWERMAECARSLGKLVDAATYEAKARAFSGS